MKVFRDGQYIAVAIEFLTEQTCSGNGDVLATSASYSVKFAPFPLLPNKWQAIY